MTDFQWVFEFDALKRKLKHLDGRELGLGEFERIQEEGSIRIQYHIRGDSLLEDQTRAFRVNGDHLATMDTLLAQIEVVINSTIQKLQEIAVKKRELAIFLQAPRTVKSYRSPEIPNVNWQALVRREEQLRLSDEIQSAYREKETDASLMDWIDFTGTVIQPQVLREAGLEPSLENLTRLRVAAQSVPEVVIE